MKPKLLDLFCGAGGAGRGYMDAGFDVTGVDIEPQPDYPGTFIQGDAIAYLAAHGHEYDAIHASPPCQASSALTKGTNKGREYLNLIPATRALLALHGVPTVIENVQGSDLRRDFTLCGEMFGLGVIRHRYFECAGFTAIPLSHKPHRGRVAGWRHGEWFDGPYFAVYGEGGGKGSVAQWQEAMGMHHTSNRKSIAEAIPPAFARFVGGQIMQRLESQAYIEELKAGVMTRNPNTNPEALKAALWAIEVEDPAERQRLINGHRSRRKYEDGYGSEDPTEADAWLIEE